MSVAISSLGNISSSAAAAVAVSAAIGGMNMTAPPASTQLPPAYNTQDLANKQKRSAPGLNTNRFNSSGYLYCKNGFQLEINLDGTVRGTLDTHPKFGLLQFMTVISVAGILSMKGVESGKYLCMNKTGHLYGSDMGGKECRFNETLLENHHNTYSSALYPSLGYLGLHNGTTRLGHSRYKDSVQFLRREPTRKPSKNIYFSFVTTSTNFNTPSPTSVSQTDKKRPRKGKGCKGRKRNRRRNRKGRKRGRGEKRGNEEEGEEQNKKDKNKDCGEREGRRRSGRKHRRRNRNRERKEKNKPRIVEEDIVIKNITEPEVGDVNTQTDSPLTTITTMRTRKHRHNRRRKDRKRRRKNRKERTSSTTISTSTTPVSPVVVEEDPTQLTL